MAKLTAVAPVLMVKDVAASARYFHDCVGFSFELFGDPPDFCIAERNGHHLMLAAVAADKQLPPFWKIVNCLWNAYFWVDDADGLYAELKARGAKIDYELCNKPYGVREFGIQDLDEQDIAFGQILH